MLSAPNKPPRPQSILSDYEWTIKNSAVFRFNHSKVNYSIFLKYSNSLIKCKYHEFASAIRISLAMLCCFSSVIWPKSLCVYHADGFLTERPNYADTLAANSMRDIWKSLLYCIMMGINPSEIWLLLQSCCCLHLLQAVSAIWCDWRKLQSKIILWFTWNKLKLNSGFIP